MFSSIVVPLDRSRRAEEALRPAASLATRWGVPVDLVTVSLPVDDPNDDEQYLKEVAARVEAPVAEQRVLQARSAAPALLELIDNKPDALPCLTSHGRSGVGQLVLGSVSEALVRDLHRPVLLIGPNAGGPVAGERVVACLDGSPLAERILEPAARWARELSATLWIVQVLTTMPLAIDNDLLESGYAHRVASGLEDGGFSPEWEILHGTDPADAIVEHVAGSDVALVAMTTHGRSGLSRLALGSVAMRVVHRASVPVLVLRPVDL